MTKREELKKALLKAYEEYMKTRIEFVKETGWNIKSTTIYESTAEFASERDEFVKKMSEIDKKYERK